MLRVIQLRLTPTRKLQARYLCLSLWKFLNTPDLSKERSEVFYELLQRGKAPTYLR